MFRHYVALIEEFQTNVIEKKATVLSASTDTTLPEVTTPSPVLSVEDQLKNTTGKAWSPYMYSNPYKLM